MITKKFNSETQNWKKVAGRFLCYVVALDKEAKISLSNPPIVSLDRSCEIFPNLDARVEFGQKNYALCSIMADCLFQFATSQSSLTYGSLSGEH